MAYLGSKATKNGTCYYVMFPRGDERVMVYLGKMPQRVAETIKRHVEDLITANAGGASVTAATSRWLADINDALADKLAKAELIEPRTNGHSAKLGPFLVEYIDGLNVKPRTRNNLHQARRWLVDYFGDEKPLSAITPGDADNWRLWLAKQGRQTRPLGKNTIRRHCGRARQFFNAARKHKLVAENPFSEMKDTTVKANRERDYFIKRVDAGRCPELPTLGNRAKSLEK